MILILSPILFDLVGRKIPVARGLKQRGIADIVESLVEETIVEGVKELEPGWQGIRAKSKRSIEDVLVTGPENQHIFVDVKSRDLNAAFSMPNLISVERLRKLYAHPRNMLKMVFLDYHLEGGSVVIDRITEAAIEDIDLGCLHVQNIGLGQLQLKDKMEPVIRVGTPRDVWFRGFSDMVCRFYTDLARKSAERAEDWASTSSRFGCCEDERQAQDSASELCAAVSG